MRFWLSIPFLHRTRIGFSVSDREIAQAFTRKPVTPEEIAQRAAEEAALDARAREIANRWAPLVIDLIFFTAVAAVVAAIWWAVQMIGGPSP